MRRRHTLLWPALCALALVGVVAGAIRCAAASPDAAAFTSSEAGEAPDDHPREATAFVEAPSGDGEVTRPQVHRVGAADVVVEVRLPDGVTKAVGAEVHATATAAPTGLGAEHATPEQRVEACGESCGRTDASGRCVVRMPGLRRVSYSEADAVVVEGVIVVVLADDFSPWIRVVDVIGRPVAGVEVEVVVGRAEVVAAATTDLDGSVRFHHVWPRGDVTGRRARIVLVGATFVQDLDRSSSLFPVVLSIGAVARLSVMTRPPGEPATVAVRALAATAPDAVGPRPSKLLRDVVTTEVVVPAGGLSFVVSAWRGDGREVEAPPVTGLVQGERRVVVLDFSGRDVGGRLLDLGAGDEVMAFVHDGAEWRARPLKLALKGSFELRLDVGARRLVFATPTLCSAAFEIDGPTVDLGDVGMSPRPLLGRVVVHDESGSTVADPLRLRAVMSADGQWCGFRLHAPVTFRQGGGGVEVVGISGVVAARLSPQRAGFHPVPEVVEVRDGANVTCRLVTGAVLEVWLTDNAPGIRDFWLRDAGGVTHFRSSAKRTDSGTWARFEGLRPSTYTLEVRDGVVLAAPVEVTTAGVHRLDATVQ
jgi:hypothetical protein